MANEKKFSNRSGETSFHLLLFLTPILLVFLLGACTEIWGAWDNVVDPEVVYTFTSTPLNTECINDHTPLLDWSDVQNARSYELQLSNSKELVESEKALSTSSSQYQVLTFLDLGTWYWRVRAKNAAGGLGAWSETWSFVIEEIVKMVNVPGGTFFMGNDNGEVYEKPVHQVTLKRFLIGIYEVTQDQYKSLMQVNPSYFALYNNASSLPVEQVSWYDAVEFCNKLSDREGLAKIYTITNRIPEMGYPITSATVTMDFNKTGYRLPSEAEWEYAAKGGALSKNYQYSGSNTIDQVGWYDANSSIKIHSVGTKEPNELGIYDMSGNVWEWCWDWYGSYPSVAQTDPMGAFSGTYRVGRGGSWANGTSYLCSSYRGIFSPDASGNLLGFRVLRRP